MNARSFVSGFQLILIATLFVAPSTIRAAGWAEVDSSSNHTLFGVTVTGTSVLAVGNSGTALYSSDSGVSWDSGDSNTSKDLYDVAYVSSSKAIAVGESGTIIRTTDSGANWTDISPTYLTEAHADYQLRTIVMASSSVGYIAGQYGMMLKTTDGGANWTEIAGPIPGSVYSLNSISATSTTKLWVAGEYGIIYTSADGGSTWTAETSGTGNDIVTIEFVDSSHGYASGENRLFLKTSDGGSTWTAVTVSDLSSTDTIDDISFLSSTTGMLSSDSGILLETTDSGSSWDTVSAPGSPVLIDISYVSSSSRYGVGQSGDIYRYDATAPSKPTNFDVSGDNDSVTDTTPVFTWTASTDGQSSIDHYEFKMDSGSYADIGDVTTKTYATALSDGSHTAYLYAVDLGENDSSVASVTFTIDSDSSSGTAPDVSSITPSTALKNYTVTFSARVSDNETISGCDLYVDGSYAKSMTLKTDLAYATTKFTSDGTHEMYARCTDNDGNKTSGDTVTVTVSSASSSVTPGAIIKIGCEGDVYVNDPCTAVYYYGYDGLRHAFPNEATFSSWFSDFDDLVTLSSAAMANITLGRNVTFRPGTTLVKFSTSTVYAISYGGILRPIATEAIATALFGSDWTSEISGVSDVFFANYRIGSTIESSSDYSSSSSKSGTATIDATL